MHYEDVCARDRRSCEEAKRGCGICSRGRTTSQDEGTGADVKWSLLVVFHRCAERVKMRASEARLQWRGYSAVHGSAHGCAAWMDGILYDGLRDGLRCVFWKRLLFLVENECCYLMSTG